MSKLLEFSKVEAGYGPLTVLHGVSLEIHAGERVCLIGRNGVGKSTTLKTIMGLTDRRSGTLSWDGADITRSGTVARSRMGIGYVPQTRDVFPSLSVEENLIAGLRSRPARDVDRAYRLFPRLHERRNNGGAELSGGEQQMLSVARTLLGRPRLLLLDEPLEGLAPIICEELMHAFDTLSREEGVAILFVEQKVQEALQFAQRAVVLDHGAVVHEGPTSELLADPGIVDRHIAVADAPA
ncbi:MAG TPA: ABC transporter ATP-binding protein [Eoetvoesiella sp.]|jgi:branched-chain amino acid transport system ATP-binding protein|uniref:ABC transporter ATP-binding protein n=1 Tax=Eoetvoesiella sp. TaxID=1966355 RepID=UPI002C34DA82|nr:ABC transporter ATP-binding protein [Eoetvoesiella sp.]HWK60262.1 ABC transporter ATP-binding protein [Eoetvoesiella sp.]